VTERHPYAYDAGGELRAAAELDPATTATMVWLTDDQVAMLERVRRFLHRDM